MITPDLLEQETVDGAVAALRRRAVLLRKKAASGVTVLDRVPAVGVTILDRSPALIVIVSESAHAMRIAKEFDRIAAEIEAEARQ